MKKRGFTLLEILVVIGIISVLVGLAVTSFTTAQKKARDAKRKSDLKAIQNCMEQDYSVNSEYVVLGAVGGTLATPAPITCGSTTLTVPTDPLNNATYYYKVDSSSDTAYSVTATMETGGVATFTVTNLQ